MIQTMKTLLFFLLFTLPVPEGRADSLLVVSWNVENFLDYRTDTTGRQTRKRFYSKCNAIAKTILLIADRKGRLPDAVALMEVGDRYVLDRLIQDTPLRKLDYGIVHYESPDRRGIDCALLYRRSTLHLVHSERKPLLDSSGAVMRTRDILLAEFDSLAILVNHHPSKVGADSDRRRAIAMKRMTDVMDSLTSPAILSVGDFNDDVWHTDVMLSATKHLDPSLTLRMTEGDGGRMTEGDGGKMTGRDGGRMPREGTIKYNGAWEKIDGYFSRGAIEVKETVFNDPCLTEPDRSFGGTKPRRAFIGPRWNGGISDHYPIVLEICYICKNKPMQSCH